jgi:hypothetical protein
MCWQHLIKSQHLRIKESTIPGANKGLFVMSRDHGQNEIVFRRGEPIIDYGGERVTHDTLQHRYGDYTAPYGLAEGRAVDDGACVRGTGTLANAGRGNVTNAKFQFLRPTKKFRIVATKNIRNNSEILVNYGRDYRLHEPIQFSTKPSRC